MYLLFRIQQGGASLLWERNWKAVRILPRGNDPCTRLYLRPLRPQVDTGRNEGSYSVSESKVQERHVEWRKKARQAEEGRREVTPEEYKARVAAAIAKFEKRVQKPWLKKKVSRTSRDYAESYNKKQIRAALKDTA